MAGAFHRGFAFEIGLKLGQSGLAWAIGLLIGRKLGQKQVL